MLRLGPPLLALAGLLAAPIARADATADARALYDQGAAAYDAGDFARAAPLLGEADAASPNPVVLGLAIQASTAAGDAVLAEDLALRADARGATGDLSTAAAQAHDRFRSRVGRVRIRCATAPSCTAHFASMRGSGGEVHAVAPGLVDAVFDGSGAHVVADVAAGAMFDLVQPPTAAALEAPRPATHDETGTADATSRRLSPWMFWTGVAVTAALGGATGASAADTQSRHDDFVANRTADNQRGGESAQLRTNVLLAGTIAGAVLTAAVGVFSTRW